MNFMGCNAFAALGARTQILSLVLKPDQRVSVDLHSCGLPANGRLIFINYTPQGSYAFPVQLHGNSPRFHRLSPQFTLYPVPLPERSPADTKVNVMFTWVETNSYASWEALLDAFEAYIDDDLEGVLIPANVAVESRLTQVMATVLRETAGRDAAKRFLSDAATYGHQLNVLLPALLHPRGITVMPDDLRGRLNRLRKLRNEVAHGGALESSISKDDVAELLCAAVFAFRYLELVESELGNARSPQRPDG